MESSAIIANTQQSGQLTPHDAELIIKTMRDTLYRVNKEGALLYASPSAENLTGYSIPELIGMKATDLYMYPEARADFLSKLSDSKGFLDNYQVELRHKQGHAVWVLINVQAILNENNEFIGIEGIIRNISAWKRIEEALHDEKEKALITLNAIVDGVIKTDNNGNIVYMNPAAEHITGYELQENAHACITDIYNSRSENEDIASNKHSVFACLSSGTSIITPEIRLFTRKDGQEFAVRESTSAILDSKGDISGAVLIFHDVTALRDMSNELSYRASHDAQTGLINRLEFEKRLKKNINNISTRHQGCILCYMDLDQFKVVNDTCGHAAGDVLLQQLSAILLSRFRSCDTIARLGGDEFGVLITQCDLQQGLEIADSIRKTIKDFRFIWEDKIFEVGVSIGVVEINNTDYSIGKLLSMADAACFVAKDNGRNRIHLYQKDDDDVSRQRLEMQWLHKINRAFEDNTFILYQQEIIPLTDNANSKVQLPVICEILVRIQDEDTLIPPMSFIPAAERYGMMQNIDRWVIEKAFVIIERLFCNNPEQQRMFSINLSGASLTNPEFFHFVLSKLEQVQFPATWICFEITETAAISNLKNATLFMEQLKKLGCNIALDDFGCGLSSFTYLKHLPVNYLKIDGSFVEDMAHDSVNAAMIESINNIGHIMNLKTIAEYVNTREQAEMLKKMGVDYAQGFLYSKPSLFE